MRMKMSRNYYYKEILILVHVFLIVFCLQQRTGTAKVQTVYIFGDSTMDVGTNNHLKGCTATANNPYYGIDYPNTEITGRFSNGYNTADYIVRSLGDYKESPPPFLSLIKDEKCNFTKAIRRGVNFASGGSGILDDTGFKRFNVVIPLGQQIQQFATVCYNITKEIGQAKAQHLLQNAFYLFSVGSNDLFDYKRYGSNLTAPDFIDSLASFFATHLQKLYHLGARKFAVIGVAPIGCCPSWREYTLDGGCMDDVNELAQNLYKTTEMLLQRMSASHEGMYYSLGDSYNMTMPILNPKATIVLFKEVKKACCGHGRFNGIDKCTEKSHLCKNRNESLFWDWVHPTQMASAMAAQLLLYGVSPLVTPVNFHQLAHIQV